ncbi:hypothetical protein LMH73_014680 [Vibrio splendidus]|nr:hypothetical protein [Vibrio splendidus]MCC4882919.1 hypothetical protein [Vibrio splendidus]
MTTSKIVIPGSNSVPSPVASMIADKIVAQVKGKYGNAFPTSRDELDAFFAPKKEKIERHTSLSFSKKKDKFRDMMCDLDFDINGYQAFKGIWTNAFNDALTIIKKAIETLPETVFLARCDTSDTLVLLEDMNINLSIGKWSFEDSNPLLVNTEEDMDGWRELSTLEDDMLCMTYMASNIAVDTGKASCGDSSGFGSSYDDIDLIKKQYGLGFIGDHSNYHSVSSEECAVVIIEAKRIQSYDDVVAEFSKRISAL